MMPVSNYMLAKEESEEQSGLKSLTFARAFSVNLSTENSGLWEENAEGTKIWRLGIRSIGAYSLNLVFERFHIPDGASLFVYSPDKGKILGAFTANNEQESGTFAIRPLAGDELIIEYNEPANAAFHGELLLGNVNHDFKNAFGDRPLGEAGDCNMDVYCSDATEMLVQKQAVMRLIIDGKRVCTGTLMNNTSEDKTPYILTAAHCIESADEATKTIFCFNYESPDCGQFEGSKDGYIDQTISGSMLKARSKELDFALIELADIPPPEYKPYYSGWNRTQSVAGSTGTVHHASGDVKKVSYDNDSPEIASYTPSYISDAFWKILRWDIGVTESGSSGGPLFNPNNELIGTLTGGSASCSNPVNDYYSMFNKQWDFYSEGDKQLKMWLDPENTGVTVLSPIEPYDNNMDACGTAGNNFINEKYELRHLEQVGGADGGWLAGTNYLGAEAFAEKISNTESALVKAFSVAPGRITYSLFSGGGVVDFKLYEADASTGLPGSELANLTVELSDLQEGSMNFIPLETPVRTTGAFFIGYELDYRYSQDTLAVYTAPARVQNADNQAYVKLNGDWKSFPEVPEYNLSSSLLMKVDFCDYVSTDSSDIDDDGERFEIWYPNAGGDGNQVIIANNGSEVWGQILVTDLMGRQVMNREVFIPKSTMTLTLGAQGSGIYLLSIVTKNGREVKKIRLMNR